MKRLILTVTALIGLATHAHAGVIFDNFKGTGATNYFEETRNATFTFGTVLNSLNTTTVNEIQFRWRPNNDMNVTLFIADSELGGTFGSLNWAPIGNNVLFQETFAVSAVIGPVDYYISTGPISFTFQANHRYDIALLGDTGTLTGSWDITNGSGNINTVQGGFESINANSNNDFGGSGPQSDAGYAGVDPHIRLLTNDVAGVPEPASVVLAGFALAGTFLGRRVFRRAKAA